MNFDFSKEPGKKLEKIDFENMSGLEPLISIIMPFYNDKEHIEQTINSLLNQTFPAFEILIIDDGSNDKESVEKLKEIQKLDSRIKVHHKENGGAAVARDYGVSKTAKTSKYIVFCDSDDLLNKTYLETSFWTLETNQKASWAYTDSIGFEGTEYTWNKWFDSNKMKKENDLVITSMIKKDDFNEVEGFNINEKNVYEDWNLWLKLIAKGHFPVHMNYYGCWYRRKAESELNRARENNERAMEIINATAKTIKGDIKAKQYPLFNYDWDIIKDEVKSIPSVKRSENNKINLLMIIPWMVMGGADQFNFDLISRLDKSKYNITIISTEPAVNTYRQAFEDYATVYDLSTFLDQKYWVAFINYIIEKNNINIILNTNSEFGYGMLPYLKAKHQNIPIIDYVHMEEWYNRNGGYSRDSSGVASVLDKTLVCNENSRKILIDHFGRNEKEVETVYIGVDEKKFDPSKYDRDKLKEKYNLPKDKYIMSFICRISEQKRPMLLLEVIKKLKETRDDFVVLIIGDGNLLNKMKSTAKKYNLLNNMIFMGRTNKTDEIYDVSDLTINCSIKEGLALTAYESLAMGVPVVSSDVGGQKELIDENTGVIVPCMQEEEDIFDFNYSEEEVQNYVDAINKILANLKKYKQNCRKKILNGFTIDQMVIRMSNILENIANKPNKQKKIESDNIDICKELITNRLINISEKYGWEAKEYNSYFGFSIDDIEGYKFELFKEKMWQHKWYRGIIRFLQKTGIMKQLKKLTNM